MTRRITILAALAAALALPASAGAATFDVDTTADTNNAAGCTTGNPCSLREALNLANTNGDNGDTVNVPAGTYTLTLGELNVTDSGATAGDVMIKGAGTRTTIVDGNGASRVFDAVGGAITIEDLTATNGSAPAVGAMGADFAGDGGAILTRADSLTLNRVAVTDSVAQLNGGAIAMPPESLNTLKSVTLDASTVAGNKVTGGVAEGLGGGIYTLGDLNLTNSTVTGNGIDNLGVSQGGGVLAAVDPAQTVDTTITLLNSTIANNSVPGTGQGGGFAVYSPPTSTATTGVSATNTIVADNDVGSSPGDCTTVGPPTSDHNFASDLTCGFNDTGSIQNGNPQLGGLADNGGPTNTLALAAGSPAIDAGTNTGCPPDDQRGTSRPQGTNCDIGAFERVPDPTPPPPSAKSADLAVSLKAKPKKPKPRGKLAYTVTVTNGGPDAAADAVLTGKVSKKIKKLKAGSPCKLGAGKRGKRSFTCDLGQIADGGTASVKLKAKLAKKARSARASARVRSQTPDPTSGNDAAKLKSKVKKKRR